jgi:predicted ATPase/class 3 adenylate cyclase
VIPERPTGTIAFLFTDIEGSTRLVARIGDAAYGDLLAIERRLVVEAAEGAGGVPFGSEGDAHFIAFETAAGAVRGAVAAQHALAAHAWPHGEPVLVRMGVHAGEASLVDGDYVGYEVHRAARVASAAHGGQVLVSGTARALAGDPGAGITLRDLGEHRLKDVVDPERLYQAEAPGLRSDFPAPRTVSAVTGNLPAQLTSFVGRAEVAAVEALLGRTRLLTLTGPGGTGKTRLSLVLAGSCGERYPDGAWFVPLAPVREPELVASAIAGSLGLLSATQPPEERVKEHLRDRAALLVLDNFEQVVDGAPYVSDLLRAAPGVTVLVSSRAPLRIGGEQEFPVPPLSVPPPGTRDPAAVLASEAGRLFAERASAVRPGFEVTEANAADVAEIVRRLDGLPLAIELAAARVRLLSPAALARRLGDRLGLLEGGGRDLPERQRTLRGAIAWSHDLLADDERRLFARLSVFAGSGPLELVDRVCALAGDGGEHETGPHETGPHEAGPHEGGDALEALERLAEQSLIRVGEDAHGDIRFGMLETIREYAAERLEERGETRRLRDRHAAAVLELVEARLDVTDRGAWLDRMDEDHDNVRAALDHAVATGDTATASALAFGAWRFWHMRGHVVEGRRRLDRVLAMTAWTDEPSTARLRTLEAAGGLAYWAGDMPGAGVHYAAAVVEARRLGDDGELANALYNHWFTRRPTSGVEDWAQLLAGDDREMLDEALEIWTRLGDEEGVAKALWGLGEHYAYREDVVRAEDATTRALEIFERLGDRFWIAWARFTRSFARSLGGDIRGSAEDYAVCLREFRASRDVSGLVLAMAALASLVLLAGRDEDAYALGAAAERATAETGLHLATLWPARSMRIPDIAGARGPLLEAAERGRAWSRDEALEAAIAIADDLASGPPGDPGPA